MGQRQFEGSLLTPRQVQVGQPPERSPVEAENSKKKGSVFPQRGAVNLRVEVELGEEVQQGHHGAPPLVPGDAGAVEDGLRVVGAA